MRMLAQIIVGLSVVIMGVLQEKYGFWYSLFYIPLWMLGWGMYDYYLNKKN